MASIVVKFSSECAIFSPPPSTTRPECAQCRTNGSLPVRDSLWAISFSWCGKIRSAPPPWMSSWSPSVARAALARLELLARRHELAVQVAVAELAVVRERGDIEVHVAGIDGVGVARLDQPGDELDDALHEAGDGRVRIGGLD